MSKTHKIKLEETIIGHKPHRDLEFREPKWKEYMSIGPAYRWVPRGDGNMVAVPDVEVIERYAEACLMEPGEPMTLSQCTLADALKIQDLFMSFFLRAEGVAAESKTSSSTSSNSSNGDQQTSPT